MFMSSNIDPKIRCLILHQDAGWSAYRISELLNVPSRTIRDWILKINKGEDITHIQEGRGRKSSIVKSTQDNLIRTARRKGVTSSTRSLANQYDVSKSSVGDILSKRGYTYRSVEKVTKLDDEVKEERIQYCQKMIKNGGSLIEKTFFSDEMGIRLFDSMRRKGWGGPLKKLKSEKPLNDAKVSCWAAISKHGATSLHIYKETLNTDLYVQIVEDHIEEMQELYPNGFSFQQDNLSVHKKAKPILSENGLDMIDFPRYSPDLNPLENLWSVLKDRVSKDQPKTENMLIKSLLANWEILRRPENLRPYFDTLCSRYRECIQKIGARLSY